jgi:hypothetical protein
MRLDEIKLDLMDWKATEKQAEDAIREAVITARISEVIRVEAKKMIRACGGKTSEEEKKIEKEKIKARAENSTGVPPA